MLVQAGERQAPAAIAAPPACGASRPPPPPRATTTLLLPAAARRCPHLQVDWQQRGVPVVGNEQQVGVSVGGTRAGHVPGRLQRRLAQQRAAEQHLALGAAIDAVCEVARGRCERGMRNAGEVTVEMGGRKPLTALQVLTWRGALPAQHPGHLHCCQGYPSWPLHARPPAQAWKAGWSTNTWSTPSWYEWKYPTCGTAGGGADHGRRHYQQLPGGQAAPRTACAHSAGAASGLP